VDHGENPALQRLSVQRGQVDCACGQFVKPLKAGRFPAGTRDDVTWASIAGSSPTAAPTGRHSWKRRRTSFPWPISRASSAT
jgi:hypothetical protein